MELNNRQFLKPLVLLAALKHFEYQATSRVLLAASEEYMEIQPPRPHFTCRIGPPAPILPVKWGRGGPILPVRWGPHRENGPPYDDM